MTLKVREVGDVLIVDVGPLISGPALNPHEDAVFFDEGTHNYLCDIRNCVDFDEGALANVVGIYWQLRPRGVNFRVVAHPEHLPLFKLTELDSVINVFIDEAEAIASFAQST